MLITAFRMTEDRAYERKRRRHSNKHCSGAGRRRHSATSKLTPSSPRGGTAAMPPRSRTWTGRGLKTRPRTEASRVLDRRKERGQERTTIGATPPGPRNSDVGPPDAREESTWSPTCAGRSVQSGNNLAVDGGQSTPDAAKKPDRAPAMEMSRKATGRRSDEVDAFGGCPANGVENHSSNGRGA